ncbi:hypothetical protein F7725_016325 [Dissostichus mawsoni]|uniref:Uncharacterized protein n=1 Tax=Dissostichus mawsoni TaxID=36200 RepID=A0A7J5Z1A9_DISMA|nr:hypothetical protein F7725_016325 [Dissostichus mawsoni]
MDYTEKPDETPLLFNITFTTLKLPKLRRAMLTRPRAAFIRLRLLRVGEGDGDLDAHEDDADDADSGHVDAHRVVGDSPNGSDFGFTDNEDDDDEGDQE